MNTLPSEVCRKILDYNSRVDAGSCRLVCRDFYLSSTPAYFRNVEFTRSIKNTLRICNILHDHEGIFLTSIRHISIGRAGYTGLHEQHEDHDEPGQSQVVEVLSRLLVDAKGLVWLALLHVDGLVDCSASFSAAMASHSSLTGLTVRGATTTTFAHLQHPPHLQYLSLSLAPDRTPKDEIELLSILSEFVSRAPETLREVVVKTCGALGSDSEWNTALHSMPLALCKAKLDYMCFPFVHVLRNIHHISLDKVSLRLENELRTSRLFPNLVSFRGPIPVFIAFSHHHLLRSISLDPHPPQNIPPHRITPNFDSINELFQLLDTFRRLPIRFLDLFISIRQSHIEPAKTLLWERLALSLPSIQCLCIRISSSAYFLPVHLPYFVTTVFGARLFINPQLQPLNALSDLRHVRLRIEDDIAVTPRWARGCLARILQYRVRSCWTAVLRPMATFFLVVHTDKEHTATNWVRTRQGSDWKSLDGSSASQVFASTFKMKYWNGN